jgi:hypothetical protein
LTQEITASVNAQQIYAGKSDSYQTKLYKKINAVALNLTDGKSPKSANTLTSCIVPKLYENGTIVARIMEIESDLDAQQRIARPFQWF